MGVKAFRIPETIDSPLTEIGKNQARELGKTWTNKKDIELVIVSPLSRALDTAVAIFNDNTPIICQEFLREYPIGEDTCNIRSSTTLLKNKFPIVDFSDIHLQTDSLWQEERESKENLEKRITTMVDYLKRRPEKIIAIVGHSSYIGQFKDNHIGYIENGDEELKHCYPYEYKL
jgi:broad specificity phosphatase PhoE